MLFPEEDEDEEDEDEEGGLRNGLARNALAPEPGGALLLKPAVSGVLWGGLEK